jgi:hypothetical protein
MNYKHITVAGSRSDLPHRRLSEHVRGSGIRRQPNHNSEI